MALFRIPRLRRIASGIDRALDCFSLRERSDVNAIKPRRLQIDPLEERQLLSLTTGSVDDSLVNETDSEAQFTVLCTPRDDPFVPGWLVTCGTCGANFGEATELTRSVEAVEPYEPVNSRIVLVALLLMGTLLALGVYFMVIGSQ